MIGESKGMAISKNQKDRYGCNSKTRLYESLSDTCTVKAPFEPFEGLIVPDIYDYESMCLKITEAPNLTESFFLLL